MASNESKIPVGTILVGKYRVVREIGRGGMAAVYEAEQLSLGKKVAVKVLASELSASTIVIERFFREARAAASVKSPYIVDVYDSGRLDDGRPFIAMELLEGESLYDRMARVRIIDVDTTIRVIVHTAKGLIKAHQAGIVHRDLKPENIFLTKGEDGDDICKILDFGLAKFYAPVNPEEKAAKRLTREGAVFGTPAYMSPEQVKGQGNVDHRADLWALGCMAYECLIGRPVWNMDQGVAMTFAAIATGPIPVPSAARADLPPSFDAWFKKCLERDPNKRFQQAKELADAFIEAWGQRPQSSASYPNVGSGLHRPPPPGAAGSLEAQEISADPNTDPVNPMLVPPATTSRRGNGAALNGGRGSVASDASVPVPLVQRISTDLGGTAEPHTPVPKPKPSPIRMALSAIALTASLSTAIFIWIRFLSPQVFAPIVQSTASSAALNGADAGGPSPLPPADEPKWAPLVAEGQRLFSIGQYADAQKKFGEVQAMGGQALVIGRVYAEQTARNEKPTGACQARMFSRPRMRSDRKAERPAIVTTAKGTLVTWVDDHEQEKRDHVYGVVLDNTGRGGALGDMTPEAAEAARPQLLALASDRIVLLYWDEKGKERGKDGGGVRARLLDGDGRIDQLKGAPVYIGGANTNKGNQLWPAMEKGPDGLWVVWQDDREKEGEYDLFTRHLSNDLDTLTPETRLTDYVSLKKNVRPPSIRFPSVAVAASNLIVAYRLETEPTSIRAKDRERNIWRLRVPLSDLQKGGLEESKDPNRSERIYGNDAVLVNQDKTPAEAPAIACGNEGCFIVWHGENGGAYLAKLDPVKGEVIWHKKFADKGSRPALGVNAGQVAIAYYEKNVLKMGILSGDPVVVSNPIFRVWDPTSPRPSIAAGASKGEWAIAWQDSDVSKASITEIYAARVFCR